MSRITQPPATFDAGANESVDDPLDEVVAACLESDAADLEGAIVRACESDPASAAEIRRRIERLRAVGILHPLTPSDDERFPERLGEFQLVERLGGGGMGVVFRARQTSLARDVALKLIRPEHLYFPQARARFRREAEAVARLQHPGIVPIYAVGEDNGIPFFAMELVGGATLGEALRDLRGQLADELTAGDLARALQRCTPAWMKWDEAAAASRFRGRFVESVVRLLVQVADALHHAHARGVVHRDVKPSNVAVTAEGRALLFDFGLASLRDGAIRITRSRAELGSLAYMSPEQLRGANDSLDARSDVYSLGVTLYESLALQLPFAERDPVETRRAILDGSARPLRTHNRAVSRDLETVCRKAMDRDASRRYADAAAFARDLRNVLEQRPVEARPASAWVQARRVIQRHPIATTAIAAMVALPSALFWQKSLHAGELTRALDETQAQREAAQREARESGELNAFLLRVFGSADPANARGREISARDMLDEGALRLESELHNQPLVRAKLLNTIGASYTSLGEWDRAEKVLQRAFALNESTAGAHSLAMAESLRALADLERELGHPIAREHAERAVALHRELESSPSAEYVTAMLTYALTLDTQGAKAESEQVYREALALTDQLPADRRSARSDVLVELANLQVDMGNYEPAVELTREAIELRRAVDPAPHPQTSSALNAMALALTGLGRHDEALAVYEEVLDEERRLTGEESTRFATFLVSESNGLFALDRSADGIDALEHASAIFRRVAPATHPFAIRCQEKLGVAYQGALRWQDSLVLYEALTPVEAESAKPADGREIAIDLRMALAREALGDWTGFERGLTAALERVRPLGSEDDDGAESQANAHLARALARRGELAAAGELIERSVRLRGGAGTQTVTGAWSRFGAGVVAQLAGDFERARAEFEPLAALESCPGHAACVPARARAHLAAVLAASEPDRCRELALRAVDELRGGLGAEHPETRLVEELVRTMR